MSCLHIKHLTVSFETLTGKVVAVDDVSLDHEKRETLALVGETGCGKSVIARSILRLLPDNALVRGEIFYQDMDLLRLSERELADIRGQEIAIIFQNPTLALNPVLKIGDQIFELFRVHRRASSKGAREYARSLLERMGFENPAHALQMYPSQFSEGMNQRVLIAMAIALHPKIVIADEPTKGLDERLKEGILEEFLKIKAEKESTLFLITHDLEAAQKIADRVGLMYCGQIVETALISELFAEPLHPYARALLKSVPARGFVPIPGTSPSMISPPAGCRFHPRCKERLEVCSREAPPSIEESGRTVRCHLYR
ncbi:MAG: ABC transporter ATP-binding protein [Candidatus Aminicenantes bacterium]|jgi:oligopeptide/dipeptide ABC transporter ATP-binding protein